MHKTPNDHRETALVITSGLIVLWLVFDQVFFVYASLGIAFIGAFIPALSHMIHWVWYKVAGILGWVMSRTLLTIVFGLVVIPVAFFSRVLGKRDLLKLRRPEDTTWVVRDHGYVKSDLEKPW